jgi:hypothetical protein
MAGGRGVRVGSDRLWLLDRAGEGAHVVQELAIELGQHESVVSADGTMILLVDRTPGRGAARWVQVYALQDGRLEPRGIASGPARAPFVHGSDFYVVQRGCVARVELQATPPRPDSPIDEERCRAVDDLVARGGKPAVVELTRVAADPVAYVREAATWALARIEVPAAATALVAALGDRDLGAQRGAEYGVERLGSAAREALLLGLSHADHAVRRSALRHLLALPVPVAPEVLVPLLADPEDSAVRETAARALAKLGDPRAVPGMLRLAAASPQAQPLVDQVTSIVELRGGELAEETLAASLGLEGGPQYDEVQEDDDRGYHLPRMREVPRPPLDTSWLRRAVEAERARRSGGPLTTAERPRAAKPRRAPRGPSP